MNDEKDDAAAGFPLCLPGDRFGVSCGADGPGLGPYRLLIKTDKGLIPRSEAGLDADLSLIYGRPFSSARRIAGLDAAARALNEGHLARAMFVTQHLRLPSLSMDQAPRAAELARRDALKKASPDDEKHPGWPKDAPDSRGGEYRPKNGAPAAGPGKDAAGRTAVRAARDLVVKKTEKALARRAMWTMLRTAASSGRLLRMTIEAAGAAVPIPGFDAVEAGMLLKDLYDLTKQYDDLQRESEIAAKFLEAGPHPISELQATAQDESFPSFNAFKKIEPLTPAELEKRFGSAGEGMEWHHIVEQGPNGGVLDDRDLQSTRNIVKIPKSLHEIITSDTARPDVAIGMSPRNSLRGKSFDEQYSTGINKLKELGILEDKP